MIYNEEYETMPREGLEAIQLRRLQTTVDRCTTQCLSIKSVSMRRV